MSEFRIDQITNQSGSRGPDIAGITTFSATSGMLMPSGPTEYRGGRGRGLFGTRYSTPTSRNNIEFITISSTGNATDFGDSSGNRYQSSACASSTRGIFGGGYYTPGASNIIDFITISSTGNTFDFGDLILSRYGLAGLSNNTRGIFAGGIGAGPLAVSNIDFVTISTLGNASNFGSLYLNQRLSQGCASSTRGIISSGYDAPSATNVMQYITISTLGDSIDFGDATQSRYGAATASNSIRGVFGGGFNPSPLAAGVNTIDYVTISSMGDAIDFGDLTQLRYLGGGCASSTRGVFGGGFNPSPLNAYVNTIDYVTIMSTGNAIDFGDLIQQGADIAGCSDAHGGLGD